MKPALTSRDWLGKTLAGVILGFTLGLGLAGLFLWIMGPGIAPFSAKGQFAMWLMSPVWALSVGLVFLFRTPARAWLGLGLANLCAWAPLWALGGLHA